MFWGAMDQRNPKSISSLKTFLGDQIEDGAELSLELLTKLDLTRTPIEERNPKSEDDDFASIASYSTEPDILSYYAEKALEIVKDVIELKTVEKCSDILACKARSILAIAGLDDVILSRNCSSEQKIQNNICS